MGFIGRGKAREAWYDRNPAPITKTYVGTVAPDGGQTLRWSFTVPTGRKDFVENVFCWVMRATAATTVGNAFCGVSILPSGQPEAPITNASLYNNTVGAQAFINLAQNVLMFAGDILKGYTGDVSSGGTVTFSVNAKVTQFDA